MKGLLYLFQWGGAAILLLVAFVAFVVLCLWAGLECPRCGSPLTLYRFYHPPHNARQRERS